AFFTNKRPTLLRQTTLSDSRNTRLNRKFEFQLQSPGSVIKRLRNTLVPNLIQHLVNRVTELVSNAPPRVPHRVRHRPHIIAKVLQPVLKPTKTVRLNPIPRSFKRRLNPTPNVLNPVHNTRNVV